MFTISDDGRLAMVRPAGATDLQLTWFQRSGETAGVLGPRGEYAQVRLSPDGTRVAVATPDPQTGNRDVEVIEIARGTASRLTTNAANDWHPVWSPDSKQILFGSDREGGTSNLSHLKQSLDVSAEEIRFPGEEPSDWSRDGRWIAFGPGDIWIAPAAPDGKPFAWLATPFQEWAAHFSPDGHWIAYVSNESGRFEVYVRPFTGAPASAEGKIQISAGGGDYPVWRNDGKELYYLSGDSSMMAVDTQNLGRSPTPPRGTRLFRACPNSLVLPLPTKGNPFDQTFDTIDGRKFLVECAADPPGRFTVLLNWPFAR